ncbi:MAG: hypothetical protein IPJ88_15640 [Myxococcales bacterium]|nr:MAG: hypothetical protein IPJ88_15640 [Myxococcales bacterium]
MYPCIFSRNSPLGNVYQKRLSDILTQPKDVRLDLDTLPEQLSKHAESLTCWACRLRATMLDAVVQ